MNLIPPNNKIRHRSPQTYQQKVLLLLTAGIGLRLILATLPGYPGDQEIFLFWSRQIVLGGFPSVYSLTLPAVNYSPVVMSVLALIGSWYRAVISPDMSVAHLGQFTLAVKLVFGSFEIITALVAYRFITSRLDKRHALLVLSGLALNPVLFLNSSYWGLLDSLHTLWVILGLVTVSRTHYGRGWSFLALAALSKPPALALIPLALLYTWAVGGFRNIIRSLLVAGMVALFICGPFLLVGQWAVITAPIRSFEIYPIWSANAHNLWWLVSGARGWDFSAYASLGGVLPLSTVGSLLFVASYIYTGIQLKQGPTVERFWELSAFIALCSFVTLMGIHENHTYLALALLAIATALNSDRLPVLIILTAASTLNILIHDPVIFYIASSFDKNIAGLPLSLVTWFNSLVIVTTTVWWGLRVRSVKIRPDQQSSPD